MIDFSRIFNSLTSIFVIIIIVIGWVIFAFLTGGICIEHSGGFAFSSNHSVFEKHVAGKHDSCVRVGKNCGEIIHIPSFTFYRLEKPPYDLEIEICDETRTMKTMKVERVTVAYTNGKEEVISYDWNKDFKSSESVSSDHNGELIRTPIMRLETVFPDVVKEKKDCKIKIKGAFIYNNGIETPFEVEGDFEYEEPEWRFYLLYQAV